MMFIQSVTLREKERKYSVAFNKFEDLQAGHRSCFWIWCFGFYEYPKRCFEISSWYKCRCLFVLHVSQKSQKERCKVKKDLRLAVDEKKSVIYLSFTIRLFSERCENYYFRAEWLLKRMIGLNTYSLNWIDFAKKTPEAQRDWHNLTMHQSFKPTVHT